MDVYIHVLSVYLCISLYISVYLGISLYISVFVHTSVCIYTFVCGHVVQLNISTAFQSSITACISGGFRFL